MYHAACVIETNLGYCEYEGAYHECVGNGKKDPKYDGDGLGAIIQCIY
jgi:hypothetical protein